MDSAITRCHPLSIPGLRALIASLLLASAPALAAPASQAEMEVYTSLAVLNVCVARSAGVEFELAVAIAAETITQWIQDTHKSAIAPVSANPLSLDDLRRGAINATLIGVVDLCADQVPEAVQRDVRRAVQNSGTETTNAEPARP